MDMLHGYNYGYNYDYAFKTFLATDILSVNYHTLFLCNWLFSFNSCFFSWCLLKLVLF